MTTPEKQAEFKRKILEGLELTYQKLLVFKKQHGTPLVVMENGKVVLKKVE